MATITFTKQGDLYVGTATLTKQSALHIERSAEGAFNVYQSHVENGVKAPVKDIDDLFEGLVLDTTIEDDVYPIYLQFTSTSSITKAELIEG